MKAQLQYVVVVVVVVVVIVIVVLVVVIIVIINMSVMSGSFVGTCTVHRLLLIQFVFYVHCGRVICVSLMEILKSNLNGFNFLFCFLNTDRCNTNFCKSDGLKPVK